MATLNAMFKLFDGYSSTISKINKRTDEASKKIVKASGDTDKFNEKLEKTGASANKASGGLGKLIGVTAMVASAVKGASIVDEYTNTAARLDLINDGLQTQAELQDKIMQSANRAKGSYNDMASAVSKMGLLAGESFGSNDELVGFTELLQKSFKVSGASTSEQSSAMLQLSQAMAAGKLQGDEFRSIMENAPMVAQAIASYTGKSKGELKEMSSEGLISADIIKNSLFAASADINSKFSEMPYTFADVWNRIKNGGVEAFGTLMNKINALINTDGFQTFVSAMISGFSLAASTASWLIDTIINGWGTIGPILGLIAGALLISMIANLWAMVPPLMAQAILWMSTYWPILLIIGVIAILVSAYIQMGGTAEQVVGFVGGLFGILGAGIYNQFVNVWNFVAAFVNFFGNVFTNPIASIQALFYDLAVNAISSIESIAKGIEDLLNKIPWLDDVNITGGLTKMKDSLAAKSADIKSENDLKTFVESKEFMDYSDGYTKGSGLAVDGFNAVTSSLDGLTNTFTSSSGSGLDLGSLGSSTNPIAVEGTGSNGSVKVDMADEDLKYLRDVAERDYINKFSSNTLAPNVTISFGDVHENADADKVAGRIKKILQEEIAMCAEG